MAEFDLSYIFKQLDLHFLEYIAEHGKIPNSAGFINCINPLHPDKNPSMHIISAGEHMNTAGYCFSCNSHVTILNACHFLENKPLTGVGFYEDTLPYLCGKYGIAYEPIQIDNKTRDIYQKRCGVKDAGNIIHGMAFKGAKLNTEHEGIKHLLDRGITEESIKKFKIGVITSFKDYIDTMTNLGYNNRDWLNSADLANKGIFNPNGFTIPIFDDKKRAVGFVTRTTKINPNDKGERKYVNSLNSDIYYKSEILFNFNNYDPETSPNLWIVEGYLDAIYLTQCGIKNVVALGSTSFTEQHVDLLSRHNVKNLIIALDADEGGKNGTKLAIERLTEYQFFKSIRIIDLPDGSDPDSFVRENGREALEKLSHPEVALSPFTWTLKHFTFQDDPIVVVESAIPTIAAEESSLSRNRMIRDLSNLTGISINDIRKDVDLKVNRESDKFIEELTTVNKYVQVALSKKKIRDTKGILQEAIVKIKNLETKFENTIDNRSAFDNKRINLWNKIEHGDYKYGLHCPKFKKFEEMFDGIPHTTCLTLIGGRPSAGKSWKPGTPVLMYNGTIKKIEDIEIGDLLMGPDSTPRKVMALGSGEENMYDIIPDRGMSWGCNEPHILSLRMSSDNGNVYKKGQIFNLTIKEYLAKNNKFKHHAKLYRTGWDLPEQKIPYDPYFVGSWLGDGDWAMPKITSADLEYVEDYYNNFAKNNNFSITKKLQENNTYRLYFKCGSSPHPLRIFLDINCKINNEKRIPKEYLLNSETNRLELLAGLIDTDGNLCRTNSHTYEIATKYEGLKNDILYLSNSLGFLTTWKVKKVKFNGKNLEYYRIHISGNINKVPVKILRKKANSNISITNHQNVGFKIKYVGQGEYYGVTIDKDNLLLLADGTVTHNTTWMTALAIDIVESNEDVAVFYMSIDDTTELMTLKMLAQETGYATSKIKQFQSLMEEEQQIISAGWSWLENLSERFVMADANEGTSPEVLEAHVDWFMKEFEGKKKIFFLDNFHKLTSPNHKEKRDAVSAMSEKLKDLTRLNDLHIMMTTELRKMAENGSRPAPADLKDTVQLEYDADVIVMIHNDLQVKDTTNIIWQGEYGTLGPKSMPYLETQIWKNKMTGKTGKLAYKLNSYNLKIEEDSYAAVQAKISQNAGHQIIR